MLDPPIISFDERIKEPIIRNTLNVCIMQRQ